MIVEEKKEKSIEEFKDLLERLSGLCVVDEEAIREDGKTNKEAFKEALQDFQDKFIINTQKYKDLEKEYKNEKITKKEFKDEITLLTQKKLKEFGIIYS